MTKRTDLLANTEPLESLPVAVMIADVDGVIRYANHRIAQLTGRTPDQLTGRSCDSIGMGDVLSIHEADATDMTYSTSVLTSSGQRVPVEVQCASASHGRYSVLALRETREPDQQRPLHLDYLPIPMLDALSDGVVIVDAGETVVYANAEARRLLGAERDSAARLDLREQIAPRDPASTGEADQTSSEHILDTVLGMGVAVQQHLAVVTREDGTFADVLVSADPCEDDAGARTAVISMRDVTRVHRSEAQVSVQRDVLEMMAHRATIDRIGASLVEYLERVLPGALAVFYLYEQEAGGFTPVVGPYFPETISGELTAVQDVICSVRLPELRVTRAPGFFGASDELAIAEHPELRTCWCYPVAASSGANDCAICIYRRREGAPTNEEQGVVDTATDLLRIALERVQIDRELQTQRFNDELTGLPNRVLLLDRLDQALQRAERSDQQVALLLIDVDRLQMVNDSLGYKAGDELIRKAAERLRNLIRSGDLVARFIGDEFGVLLEHINSEQDAINVVMRIQRSFAVPLQVQEVDLYASLSIGVALADGPDVDGDTLLRYADTALERAREGGRGQFAIFSSSQDLTPAPKVELQSRLYRALAANALELHYQPLVSLQDGSVVGYEALVRWHDEQFGDISPDEFLPLAEQSGIMAEITAWVLDFAVSQATDWQLTSRAQLSIGVNVSPSEVNNPLLVEQVEAVLNRYQFIPTNLTLELTEHGLMDISGRGREILQRLRNLGIRIALDDFGTGFSSLSYLEQLPVDCIKIDRTFIQSARGGVSRAPVAAAMVDLARNLGMVSVAEGIEIEEDERIARRLGCDLSQGYYYGRPRPGSSMTRWNY